MKVNFNIVDDFNIVDEIQPTKSEKFRFVISKVPPDFGIHR